MHGEGLLFSSSFLPFNLDAATSAQVLTPLLSSRVQHPCQASKSFQNSLLPLLLGLPHSNLSPVAPPQDQLLSFLLTIGSETPLTETNSREPGLGQNPVPFRPGVPTCSPAAGKDLSVSQKSVKFLEVSSYVLLHAPLEIMNDLNFSLIAMSDPEKRNEIAASYNGFSGPGEAL